MCVHPVCVRESVCVRVCVCATWKRTSRESASKIRRTPRFRASENIVRVFACANVLCVFVCERDILRIAYIRIQITYSTFTYIIYACMHARMDVCACVSVFVVYVCVFTILVANCAPGQREFTKKNQSINQ